MYLSNIKLWNFRKYGDACAIDLNKPHLNLDFKKGLNVIIGENDSGKTAIIDAIKSVLKTQSYDFIKVDEKDFYQDSINFRIELVFSGFSSEEGKNFTEWLGWIGEGENAEPFLRLIYDVSRKESRILPSEVRAGVDSEGYQLSASAKDYLKVTYLKPLRDAENDLIAKRNSRLSQILLGDSAFKGKEETNDLTVIFNELKNDLENYFKGEYTNDSGTKPTEGKDIKDRIDKLISKFYGVGFETVFEAAPNDIKSILEKFTLLLKDELYPGLGTLNRLFMAAELLHLNKTNWTGVRLGLIEELEAHLHPQAQMQVIEALQNQKAIQLILTTHSPNLASKVKLENLIICNNNNAFPMGSEYTKLKTEDYIFLEKFLDTTKANLFFAKGIIFVEGWAEEILIPSIAKNIGINLTEKGVSIINVGNLSFSRYSKIFLRKNEPDMFIPVSVLTDSDINYYEKSKDEGGDYIYSKRDSDLISTEITNRVTDLENNSEKNVKYFVASNWTFEFCLFQSNSLSSIFQSVVRSIHSRTDWDTDFEKELAEKLINKGLKKTEIAYNIANEIDKDLLLDENGKTKGHTILIDSTDDSDSINYIINAIMYAAGN